MILTTTCTLVAAAMEWYPEQTPWNEPLLVDTPANAFLVDDVYKAIADQRLFVDLEYDDLSEPQDVVLCNSRVLICTEF